LKFKEKKILLLVVERSEDCVSEDSLLLGP